MKAKYIKPETKVLEIETPAILQTSDVESYSVYETIISDQDAY